MRGEFRGFSGGLGEALGEAVQATDGDAIGDRITVTRASLRPLLLRLAPEEHVLVLTLHHIACDMWSRGILVRELGVR